MAAGVDVTMGITPGIVVVVVVGIMLGMIRLGAGS
jgi:hypothetical protein